MISQSWVLQSRKEHPKRFSEFDVLLRALDRFFNMGNLLLFNEDITAHNFHEELLIARDTLLRVLGTLEVIIPESRKSAYWFQKFAETKYLTEGRIDAFRQDLYRQDTPEKGIYLLYDSLINIKGLLTDIVRSGHISHLSFMNAGSLISKEIRENVHFNPFRKNVSPEFDKINNPAISGIIRSIADREEKKHISIICILLFRFLRIMEFIELSTSLTMSLNSSLTLLILLRAEINTFRSQIEKVEKKLKRKELSALLDSISYQFSMETRRVYQQELKDIHRKKPLVRFRGMIENSRGILKNLTEHSVIQLAQHYQPDIRGEEVFASFIDKHEQSVRLREDISVLNSLVSLFCSKADDPAAGPGIFESLRNYMLYFENFTFRLLRYDDYEEFASFFHDLGVINKEMVEQHFFQKLDSVNHFRIFLETTLRHIGNRSELIDKPVDEAKIEKMTAQYLMNL
jgi:hypothetical protein